MRRGHCRGRHGDAEARCQTLVQLEERQAMSERARRARSWRRAKRGHQPLGSIAVRWQRLLDELQPSLVEGHRDATTVLGVAATRDDPGVLEPPSRTLIVPRGAPDTGDELALVERVVVGWLERG